MTAVTGLICSDRSALCQSQALERRMRFSESEPVAMQLYMCSPQIAQFRAIEVDVAFGGRITPT